ncbi:MAG: phosphoethanolamine transferase CptA [Azoarcus sp.]|jgi:heptose-I-phosphate ethanolaminephosphotransferase|nr:phosphoethanolamine transferase CptA [Azoarcus sp.]
MASSDTTSCSTPKRNLVGLGWLFLFFWYFSGVTQALLIPSAGFVGSRRALFMSFMWLAPVLLFPRFTKQISAVIGVILWAASVVSLSYWIIYGTEFSQSIIFIILETNAQESQEFLSQYINLPLLAGIVVYTVIACLIWKRLRPVYLPRPVAAGAAFAVLALNLCTPYIDYMNGKATFEESTNKLFNRMETTAPWQFLAGYLQYRIQLNNVQSLLLKNSSLSPLDDLVDRNGDTSRTLVLVIGESTTSRRMSLYGYPRKTTPKLDALKEKGELFAFSDVIASRPYTVDILQQALSFASQEEPDRYLTEPNLMNLMKQAGYKTFWVTNQQTISAGNTLLSAFSQQADIAKYLNNHRAQTAGQPDQVVFEPFIEILADSAPKKFIVLHLFGTHSRYSLRYPKEYEIFTGRDHVPENLSNNEAEIFNSYDNAVLYNDFILSGLIDFLSKNQSNSFLLYFSDHGEEVFNDPTHTVRGRNEKNPTLDMYAIPFVLWMSPEWRKTHPSASDFGSMLDRPYSSDHLIHIWSDLAGLSYDRFQPEKSLINSDFKPYTRWIGDPRVKNGLRDFDAIVIKKPAPPSNASTAQQP